MNEKKAPEHETDGPDSNVGDLERVQSDPSELPVAGEGDQEGALVEEEAAMHMHHHHHHHHHHHTPALPLHNSGQPEPDVPQEPGGGQVMRRPGVRSKSGIGPPPRPFKKARYAWEIKNYEHTLSNMTQSLGQCSSELQEDSQDSQDSEVNSEASQEEGVADPRENLAATTLDRAAFLDPRARSRPDLMPPIMPAPYPTTYGMMAAPPPPDAPLRPGECLKDGQQVPPDPDAGMLRWHTRQLCRSIFDNTVNRMLENMGFSPVTERTQGIHPLLVLSLSDDEEREAEEAHRALENEALTAAMHQKGLFMPPYHYDPLESGTTTDYDSSDDDSDLGEEPGPEDLAAQEAPPHLNMAHMISRPLPRVPAMQLASPGTQPPPPPTSPHQLPPPALPPPQQQALDCDLEKHVCDAVVPIEDASSCGNEESVTSLDNNKNTTVVDQHSDCTAEVEREEGRKEVMRRQADSPPQHKGESENNNDKYFVDQAIEMAIKQQGLGYQQA